ncbi:hypothetical protein WJX73_004536 [Symbiochloris irregularis]|uniref:Integral membrane bound transporter domain-containing protein n=1 Tax=Symbiochloris irregularis TaxID=706552 RepID=A0AAW1PNV6_9CHLO
METCCSNKLAALTFNSNLAEVRGLDRPKTSKGNQDASDAPQSGQHSQVDAGKGRGRRKTVGEHPFWRPGVVDHLRTYFLSPVFQCSVQLSLSILIVAIFCFVEELYFTEVNIVVILLPVTLVMAALDLSAGGRIFAASILLAATWGVVFGGILVTVARYTYAYGTFLTLFTLIYMAIVSVLRSADMMAGLVLGILGAIIVVIGQFVWPAQLLWAGVVWGLIRSLWLACAATILVGMFLFSTSAREKVPKQLAVHLREAGHALSSIAGHVMPPSGEGHASRAASKRAMHLADPATKTTAVLRPAMAQTMMLARMMAPLEPPWFGDCRVDVSHWNKILEAMQPLVTRIAVLESLLEGHEPMLHSHMFMEDFGINPLPVFKSMLATAAASLACMSDCIAQSARGGDMFRSCSIASAESDVQHAAWRFGSKGEPDAEKAAKDHPSWIATVKARAEMELQPVIAVLKSLLGINILMTAKNLVLESAPRCWGSREKAWQTIRRNRYFRFGLMFFGSATVCVTIIIPLSFHSQVVRNNRQYFAVVAALSSYQERADNSLMRIVFRLLITAIAASIGLAIMHGHPLASNPYGLTALSCAWAFFVGSFALTPFKYAAFLAVMIFNAMIFSQFSYTRAPGAHGTTAYYISRVSEYSIGICVALIFTLLDPWYLSEDALQQTGAVVERCIELSCSIVEAYLEETALPDGAVAVPLGQLEAQVNKEKVAWRHGPLVLPGIVFQSMQRLQLLLERASLLEMMVTQEALTSYHNSAALHTFLQGMDQQLQGQLQALRSTGKAIAEVLWCHMASQNCMTRLQEHLQELDQCRYGTQAALRRLQMDAQAQKRRMRILKLS